MLNVNTGRLTAVMVKEFIQLLRDKATLGMIIGIPLMQLIMFGFAINTNPRNLPVALVNPDDSVWSRRIVSSMQNSTYFHFLPTPLSESDAHQLLKMGDVQFIVNFPTNFSRDLVKGLHPYVLLEVDATDPAATGSALSVFNLLSFFTLKEDLKGNLAKLNPTLPPYQSQIHQKYNPLAITAYNIVPGLLGVVLTMSLVIVTALMITRETERGTMEMLLATPLRPLEVMLGKLLPFVMIGYIQIFVILILARLVFHIPVEGSIVLLFLLSFPFIVANLSVGLTFSTLATNQLQAVQSATFFFLPSIILSGFMFPFRGMPEWAQWVGNVLPLTHYLIIVRGILLKGNGFMEVWQQVIPIILFAVGALFLGVKRYRNTLD